MESRQGEFVLPQLDQTERKLKVDWPSKDDLILDRNKFVKDYLDEEILLVREVDSSTPPDLLDQVAKVSLDVKFMIGLMQKISPIPLDAPINIKLIKNESLFPFSSYFDIKSGKPKATIFINIPKVSQELVVMQSYKQLSMDASSYLNNSLRDSDNISWNQAMSDAVDKVREKKAEFSLSFSVHEFAHLIYAQEAFRGMGGSKERGLQKENEFVVKKFKSLQDYIDEYAQLDMENRARIWQIDFLNHYFPDSKIKKFTLALMEKGFKAKKKVAVKK